MANQIAVGVHAGPGDELLCGATAHVYVWEGGGIARLSGCDDAAGRRGRRPAVARTAPRQDPSRRWTLRPHPAGERSRTRTTAAADGSTRSRASPRSRAGRPRTRPGVAPGRRPADECGGRLGHRRERLGAALRHSLDLLLEGPGGARRLGDRGPIGADPQGASAAKSLRWRNAAGGIIAAGAIARARAPR